MAQRAVAGHIAGIVQDRQSAATHVPVLDHDDRQTADRPASAENPARIDSAGASGGGGGRGAWPPQWACPLDAFGVSISKLAMA